MIGYTPQCQSSGWKNSNVSAKGRGTCSHTSTAHSEMQLTRPQCALSVTTYEIVPEVNLVWKSFSVVASDGGGNRRFMLRNLSRAHANIMLARLQATAAAEAAPMTSGAYF